MRLDLDWLHGAGSAAIRELRNHYEDLDRPKQSAPSSQRWSRRVLGSKLTRTRGFLPRGHIPGSPGGGEVKSGRYWTAYTTTRPPVIAAVFYEAADIEGRH